MLAVEALRYRRSPTTVNGNSKTDAEQSTITLTLFAGLAENVSVASVELKVVSKKGNGIVKVS